jgi:hypothetical protein
VQELKLLLVVGRRLVFPAQSNAAVSADLTTQVQFQAADGTTVTRTVSLMFPANCRAVARLMEAWYDAQVSMSLSQDYQHWSTFASPPVTLVLVPDNSMPKGCWVHEQHAPTLPSHQRGWVLVTQSCRHGKASPVPDQLCSVEPI